MTIASYCVELLSDRGPLTAEELGRACQEVGLSAAKDPSTSVAGALSWSSEGRVLRIGDRYHLVTSLLDGRWLTFRRPATSNPFPNDLDLAPLRGSDGRHDIPVRGGGVLASTRKRGWTTVACELPDADFIGMRLDGGTAVLTPVQIDDAARERGDQLAGLLRGSTARQVWFPDSRDLVKTLLELVHRDDEVLREPVPPFSELFPEYLPKPVPPGMATALPYAHRATTVVLPDEVHDTLSEVATRCGETVGQWLAAEVSRLVWWPHAPPRVGDLGRAWSGADYRVLVDDVDDHDAYWAARADGEVGVGDPAEADVLRVRGDHRGVERSPTRLRTSPPGPSGS